MRTFLVWLLCSILTAKILCPILVKRLFNKLANNFLQTLLVPCHQKQEKGNTAQKGHSVTLPDDCCSSHHTLVCFADICRALSTSQTLLIYSCVQRVQLVEAWQLTVATTNTKLPNTVKWIPEHRLWVSPVSLSVSVKCVNWRGSQHVRGLSLLLCQREATIWHLRALYNSNFLIIPFCLQIWWRQQKEPAHPFAKRVETWRRNSGLHVGRCDYTMIIMIHQENKFPCWLHIHTPHPFPLTTSTSWFRHSLKVEEGCGWSG